MINSFVIKRVDVCSYLVSRSADKLPVELGGDKDAMCASGLTWLMNTLHTYRGGDESSARARFADTVNVFLVKKIDLVLKVQGSVREAFKATN